MTMPSISELVFHARTAEMPTPRAPWPDEMDVARWMWEQATPEWWRDQYPAEPDLDAYLLSPHVWGVTDQMYTSDTGTPSPTTPGWTMGEGGRFELRTVPRASEGYVLWEAFMQPLQQARDIIDRAPARFDALQAPDAELDRLSLWGNIDPQIATGMPIGLKRRYARYARKLEQVRGSEAMEEALGDILGVTVEIVWDTDEPFKRVVAVYGQTGAHTKRLIRRNLPPHINVEMLTIIGFSGYTDSFYTAPADLAYDADDGEQHGHGRGYTATQRTTSEFI